jgi:hypothetical protein
MLDTLKERLAHQYEGSLSALQVTPKITDL